MGLDMYLYRSVFVGAEYKHRDVRGEINLTAYGDNERIEVDVRKVSQILEKWSYWRKANAIHGWIIKNCADGVDDCRPIYLSLDKLHELRDLCKQILDEPPETRELIAAKLLPPCDGFFFGSQKLGDDYFADLRYTVEALADLPDGDYWYQASW